MYYNQLVVLDLILWETVICGINCASITICLSVRRVTPGLNSIFVKLTFPDLKKKKNGQNTSLNTVWDWTQIASDFFYWAEYRGMPKTWVPNWKGIPIFTRDLGTQITVLLAHLLSTLNIPFACKPAQLAGTWYHDARISVTENWKENWGT